MTGKMVPAGSVSFLFKLVGAISISLEKDINQATLEMKAIEAGAEDTLFDDNLLTVYTKIENVQKVKENLEKENITIDNAGLIYLPTQKHTFSDKDKDTYEKLLEALDEQDDTEEIYDNL